MKKRSLIGLLIVCMMMALAPSLYAATPYDDAISYWAFDEGQNNTAYDTAPTGNNNNGSISGATWVAGKIGDYALYFDGNNDWVNIGTSPFYEKSAIAMSIAMWVYTDPADWNNTLKVLADTSSASPTSGNGGFWIGPDDRTGIGYTEAIHFDMRGTSGSAYGKANNVMPTEGWYHIVGTYDSTGYVKIYVNGVDSGDPGASAGNFKPKNASMYIGTTNTQLYDFMGTIDEVAIWGRALTQSEVDWLYGQGEPVPEPMTVISFALIALGMGARKFKKK